MATKVKTEADRVESAIRSLYQLFQPPPHHGCSRVKTKDVAAIEKRIAHRKRELDNDPKLIALTDQLTQARKEGFAKATALHRRVDSLLRKLQLRGVTDGLLKEIESLERESPVLIGDDCE